MTKFFERYSELCAKAGTTPNGATKIIGISSASITDWKTGAMPRSNAIEKISAYFGVTTDYLMGYTDTQNKRGYAHLTRRGAEIPGTAKNDCTAVKLAQEGK